MQICKLGHGMAHFFVDGTGNLPALHVYHRNVEVRGGNGGGDGLVTVGNTENHLRGEIIKYRRQLDDPGTGGFGAGNKILALHLHINGRDGSKSVLADNVDDWSIALKKRRACHYQLQFEISMLINRFKNRLDPGIARPRGDDHTDFTALITHSCSQTIFLISFPDTRTSDRA